MSDPPVSQNQGTSNDETARDDDAIIGRMFRWSALGILLIAAVVGTAIYLMRPSSEPVVVDEGPIVLPKKQERVAEPPAVQFVEVGASIGVDFVHTNGARGDKLLPETMGGGCAAFDYDSDGDPDLLFVNSDRWSGDTSSEPAPVTRLFRNDGAEGFRDVTAESGLGIRFYGMGVATGDYDNDGDPDVFLSGVGPNRLFINEGGRFRDVTAEAGVAGGDDSWSSGSGFFDYDNDGLLDLFVCNYVRWTAAIDREIDFQLTGVGRAYGPPNNFEGSHSSLYRNLGNGSFEDVSESAGIRVNNPATGKPLGKALAILPIDFDQDGWIDLVVANDTVQNFLFHNQSGEKFDEIGSLSGIAYDSRGLATGAMGIDGGHYRDDDTLAVAIANFANERSSLYVAQEGGSLFTDESITEGIGPASLLMLSFGLFFFDYDLDGKLDLLQANGHLEEEIHVVQSSQQYRQSAQLFWNCGQASGRCFVVVDAAQSGDLARPIVGRGATYADLDKDGDLDVVLTQIGGHPLVLRNDQQLGHHWLRVKLRGTTSNRDAIGAWVELSAGGHVQRRQVMPTRSYLSQVELPVTFGLAESTRVDSLRVRWPSGKEQEVSVPGVDRVLEIVEE